MIPAAPVVSLDIYAQAWHAIEPDTFNLAAGVSCYRDRGAGKIRFRLGAFSVRCRDAQEAVRLLADKLRPHVGATIARSRKLSRLTPGKKYGK